MLIVADLSRLREFCSELCRKHGVSDATFYGEERLSVRKRGGRKRALGTRAPIAIPQDQNLRWSLDFVMDTLAAAAASVS